MVYCKFVITEKMNFIFYLYLIGLTPLLLLLLSQSQDKFDDDITKNKQMAYADDLNGMGKLKSLRKWWDLLIENGPKYGYKVNPPKSYLIVKSEFYEEAIWNISWNRSENHERRA